jgi:hypothetical protein
MSAETVIVVIVQESGPATTSPMLLLLQQGNNYAIRSRKLFGCIAHISFWVHVRGADSLGISIGRWYSNGLGPCLRMY